MKVIQILPELNAGGVERGTLEVASALVADGHESMVISNGGRLVTALEAAGSRHISMPVHKKSLTTLGKVKPMRQLLEKEKPDVIHIRSRAPGWVTWLAWRKMDPATRPRLVSTVHGFYSTNFYSAVMTRGERVIAVSNSIRDYILKNYPKTPDSIIRVIHRGVSPDDFPRGYQPSPDWQKQWELEQAQTQGKKTLLLPGRVTRWKGQQDFIQLIAALKKKGENVHGLICGDAHPKKRIFLTELRELAESLGVEKDVTFLGHRSDVGDVMATCDIAFSLSRDPEAFGRVSLEAAAIGKPIIGYDHGGVAEQLAVLFPQGCVPVTDASKLLDTTLRLLNDPATPKEVEAPFTREAMTTATLAVYEELNQASRP